MVAAMVARVRRTAHDAMMLGDCLARFAIDAIWVEAIAEPFKAYGISGELLVKILLGVADHFRFAVHGDYLQPRLSEYVPTVKG